MALTYSVDVKNAATDAVVDRVDLGSTNAQGRIAFLTNLDAVVVVCNMANPAFGASALGIATAGAIATGTVAGGAGGNVAKFQIRDRDNAAKISGVVGVSGSDWNVPNVALADADTLTVDSLTYQAF